MTTANAKDMPVKGTDAGNNPPSQAKPMGATAALASINADNPNWSSGLSQRNRTNVPIVDVCPFVFKGRLYLLEHWKKEWDYSYSGETGPANFMQDELRIRDVATDEFIGAPMPSFGFGTVLVHDDKVTLFFGPYTKDISERLVTSVWATSSADLLEWSEPQAILRAESLGQFLGLSACRGDGWFVLAVLTLEIDFPHAIIRYWVSEDLADWSPVPDAIYGREGHVIGQSIYFDAPYYYALYSRKAGGHGYNSYLSRSRDMVNWEDASSERPLVTYQTPVRPPALPESNASDPRVVFFQNETRLYFTGGDRETLGDLQFVTFPGPPRQLFDKFFEDPRRITFPSRVQALFHDDNLGVMIHFGMTTYTNGDMLLLPEKTTFNPVGVATDQWLGVAQALGATYAILTVKHYNGFCIWPTVTSSYCVKNSPWKGGRGDVVRDFVDSCRKYKIRPGLYISPGDYNKGVYSNNAPVGQRQLFGDVNLYFRNIFHKQIQEILKNYGELACVMLDTTHDPFGWDVKSRDGKSPGVACGAVIYNLIRELQPNAVIMGGLEPDVRRSGTNKGHGEYPVTYHINKGEGPKYGLSPVQQGWVVPENLLLPRPNRFWTPGSDSQLLSPEDLTTAYLKTVGQGSNLLINLTPDPRGLIADVEANRMRELAAEIKRRTLLLVAKSNKLDHWREGQVLELELDPDTEKLFDHVIIEEDIRDGQRIQAYRLEALQEGKWELLAEGQSIGRKRIHPITPMTAKVIRLKITKSLPRPQLRYFAAINSVKPTGPK